MHEIYGKEKYSKQEQRPSVAWEEEPPAKKGVKGHLIVKSEKQLPQQQGRGGITNPKARVRHLQGEPSHETLLRSRTEEGSGRCAEKVRKNQEYGVRATCPGMKGGEGGRIGEANESSTGN